MRLEELKKRIREVEEMLGGIGFTPYIVKIWNDVTELQGDFVPEVKEAIEARGFQMVHSFQGEDEKTVFYVWKKGNVEVTMHT